MPITLTCACGKTLQVKDEFAGRRVKCPACAAVASVPAAAPQFEVVDDEPAPPPRAAPVRAKPAGTAADDDDRPRKRRRDEDDDDDERPRKKRRAEEDADDEDRPRKKRRRDDDEDEEEERPRKKKRRKAAASSGNSSNRVGYIVGGLICVLIGGAIAYFAYNSDHRRANGRMIGGIVMAVFGFGSAIRGAVGAVPDDDEE